MGFKEGDFPPVDPATFLDKPLFERTRTLALHWVDYGFGTAKMVHTIYIVKLLVLYLGIGLTLITTTSDLGAPWDVGAWWDDPIVYQKLVLWTMFLETLGLAGSWGPLAGKFKPMMGGALFWLRPDTIRVPPWPDHVPGTKGDARAVIDIVLYAGLLITLLVPVLVAGTDSGIKALPTESGLVPPELMIAPLVLLCLVGLRDKVIFIASRAEQYAPALVAFALVPVLAGGYIDMIVLLKVLIVMVWIGAGISKIGVHFSNVVPPMISNTPFLPGRAIRRAHYKNFPDDIRPSGLAHFMAHVGGTFIEIVVPLVLLFTTNWEVTLVAVGVMVIFHLFITQTFPLAVPLEWNLLFAFAVVFLFVGFPNADGYSVFDATGWVVIAAVIALAFFPVLGNLRPDLVAFTPSMRQYAGNWASALWAFQPGAEDKLNRVTRPTTNQVEQLQAMMGISYEEAEITMQQTIGWRSMHSQGRGLFSVLTHHVSDLDRATVREAEFACNSLVGFNFGDGHLHDYRFIEALQRRCRFDPGEFIVAWVESQPIHKDTQDYLVIDAAVGIIERGTWNVHDCANEQPWLPNGPIPLNVTWRRSKEEAPSPTA